MNDRRHLLKIKLKSLAAEARIIKRAERGLALPTLPAVKREEAHSPGGVTGTPLYQVFRMERRRRRAAFRNKEWYGDNRAQLDSLHRHRVLHLRRATRETVLAYGFLRGRTLEQIEGAHLQWLTKQHPSVALLDAGVYQEAAKMAARYGSFAVTGTDIQRDFFEWTKQRVASLHYVDGKQLLAMPTPEDMATSSATPSPPEQLSAPSAPPTGQ